MKIPDTSAVQGYAPWLLRGVSDEEFALSIDRAAKAGQKVAKLSCPTAASMACLAMAIGSIQAGYPDSKRKRDQKKTRMRFVLEMFKSGWIGQDIEAEAHDVIWSSIMHAMEPSLVQAAMGAGMRAWTPSTPWSRTALGMAVRNVFMEGALLMAKAMSPGEVDLASRMPGAMMMSLALAWDMDRPEAQEMWKLWQSKGLDINQRVGEKGRSVLMGLCVDSLKRRHDCVDNLKRRHDALVRLMAWGADPNLADDEGSSPLHRLCEFKEILESEASTILRHMQALLAGGANPLGKDAMGLTPIELAKAGKWLSAIEMLLPYQERMEIDDGLGQAAKELGLAVMELRREGFQIMAFGPDGASVGLESAMLGLKARKAKMPPANARKKSI